MSAYWCLPRAHHTQGEMQSNTQSVHLAWKLHALASFSLVQASAATGRPPN